MTLLNNISFGSTLFSDWTEYTRCDDNSLPDIVEGFHVRPFTMFYGDVDKLNDFSLFINEENDAIESSDSFESDFHTNKYLSISNKEKYNEFRI